MDDDYKYFLIQETKFKARTESSSYSLLDGKHKTYEEAVSEAARNVGSPNQVIYVAEVKGKVFGSLKINSEKV